MTIHATTARQLEVLRFLRDYQAAHKYGPTVREICAQFDFSSPNGAHEHLRRLVRAGMISRQPGMARTLAVTQKGVELLEQEAAT